MTDGRLATPILQVDHVSRSFGGVKALSDVSLEVAAGESAALIGPNGSGKSTLVNVITRMVDAESGTIRVAGADVTHERRHLMASRGVGRTFQHVRLMPDLTLRENALAGALSPLVLTSWGSVKRWFRGGAAARAAFAAADAALDLMEVSTALRERSPREVSFAIQRRTEIARALAASPKIVLLDEPAAGMNPTEVNELSGLLRAIRDSLGAAILLIDHNMEFVMGTSETVTVINRGVRIAHGSAESVRNDPAVIEAYLGVKGAADRG
jgi:branched-chain amino acid transport system ATP-binding protein